ncbi:hypothetical protein ACMZ5M_20075 [Streptomyces rhizosphaericola]|uniref:hypothetical protein n=1 Tax=Streptomyces rhizosphaericola TaxID=2564098 RepID=UPI0039F0A6E6
MSTTRRPLGTGPRTAEEQSPIGDQRERGRTAAERAAVEPPALAVDGRTHPFRGWLTENTPRADLYPTN